MSKSTKILVVIDILLLLAIPIMGWWGDSMAKDSEAMGSLLAIYPAFAFGVVAIILVIKLNFFNSKKK
jgi:hypothetical protein